MVGGVHAQAPPPLAPLPKIPGDAGAEETPAAAAQAAPADVVASAVAAVASLGDEVVQGRYKAALDRMNPQWKKRVAQKTEGGMEALEKQLEGVTAQMIQNGITMVSFRPEGLPRSYEVSPGRAVEKVNGQDVEKLIFNQWMVLVPTTSRVRITPPNNGKGAVNKPVLIDSTGFQVAISDKGKNNWTFIDGSGLSVNELRGLFGTLPADLKFPPVEKREAR